jgi:polyhydroxyalkanoate synthesis regulator phasin
MKTNNPFIDSIIETQTNVMNNWMDTTKKFQTAITNGNITDEGQNIYKEWFEKQSSLLGGMQAGTTNPFAFNQNKPEEFFKNWYNQQLNSIKQMTDFNQSIYNSVANYGKPANDYMNNFATMNSSWTNIYNSWINTLNTTYDTFSKNLNNPFNKDMFKNMFESNQVYLKAQEAFQPMLKAIQSNDFSAETWKNIYNVDSYKKVTEQLFGNFFQTANMKDVYDNLNKQIHDFFVNQSGLSKEYFAQIQGMKNEFPNMFSGNFEKVKELYSQVNNVFEKTFEPVLKLASPGKEKENVEAAIALMDKIAEYTIKQNELQYSLYSTTQKSLEAVAKEYADKFKDVKPGEVPNAQDVYNDWVKVSEKFFAELLATDEFSKMKSETIGLGMDVKKQFEKQFENVFGAYPVVFRTEIEELYKTIYDLKKTVKDLQNKLAINGVAVDNEDEKSSKGKKK